MPLYFRFGINWSQAQWHNRLHIILACGIMALGLLFYSIVAETDEPAYIYYTLKPMKVVQGGDGWTCLTSPLGKEVCFSEHGMQMLDAWRAEVNYLPKEE